MSLFTESSSWFEDLVNKNKGNNALGEYKKVVSDTFDSAQIFDLDEDLNEELLKNKLKDLKKELNKGHICNNYNLL